MSAFVISEVIIRDKSSVEAYKPIAAASVAELGGRYVVRDAAPSTLEGAPFDPRLRIVIIEFDSPEAARAWYESPSYRQALDVANGALDRHLFVVTGLPDQTPA